MVNEKLKEAMTQQVTEEYRAAYIYRYLANEMDALSLSLIHISESTRPLF